MSEVKRYNVDEDGFIFTDTEGKYVSYDDYKELEDQVEELKATGRSAVSDIIMNNYEVAKERLKAVFWI